MFEFKQLWIAKKKQMCVQACWKTKKFACTLIKIIAWPSQKSSLRMEVYAPTYFEHLNSTLQTLTCLPLSNPVFVPLFAALPPWRVIRLQIKSWSLGKKTARWLLGFVFVRSVTTSTCHPKHSVLNGWKWWFPTISYVKILNYPIETTIYKWMFQVPGISRIITPTTHL